MEGLPEDLWSPFKYVQKQLQRILANKSESLVLDLEGLLKKCKHSFVSLLKNPPKNDEHRKKLMSGKHDGLLVCGANRNLVLSKDLIDESLILSDMFELDEIAALELLCTAQRQMHQHPGLPRGLVAILLYYDGRKAITQVLRDLFQATSGVTWVSDAPKEIVSTVSEYSQSLVDDFDVLRKIIDILVDLDFAKENLLLTKNRALGTKKHQNQVKELFEDIRMNLAMALFNWSAQRGLPKAIVEKLLLHLKRYSPSESTGNMDDVTLVLLMSLIYSYDVCILNRQENDNVGVRRLPLFNEPQFLCKIYEILQNFEKENFFLGSIIKFSLGIALTNLRHVPAVLQDNMQLVDRDEDLVDQAIASQVFYFLYNYAFEKELLYRNEFFYMQMHNLLANFIDLMSSKITELRGKADESAKAIMTFSKEGLDPPASLDRNFEYFLLCISKLYKDNKANLSLCTEYWGPLEVSSSTKFNARSISLFKFIRLSGELLPSTLFVPYLKMIAGLAGCEQSARSAFNFFKQTSGLSGSSTLSWEHFFNSLIRYYGNLREDVFSGTTDTIYRSRAPGRLINPNELEGLISVLELVKAIGTYDEMSRLAITENLSWNFVNTLIGLLSCSVSLSLKAEIMNTLAALAKSKDIATVIWNRIEASQIISTIPTINSLMSSNIIEDINQNEARMETFPLTKGILDLFYVLIKNATPKNLGGGQRKPGLDPYMDFLMNGIFLKFYNRNYKNPSEKWEVGEKSLKIFDQCLKSYEISGSDFDQNQDHNPPPGYHVMIQTQTKSDFLRLLLLIIDDFSAILDDYNNFDGKQKLQECAFYALDILQTSLFKQDLFFDAYATSTASIMVFGLHKILLDINPRSGRPDHMMNILKFVTYWTWLPYQALFAIKILTMITRSHSLSQQVIGLATNDTAHLEIRQGFVENLESEMVCASPVEDNLADDTDKFPVDLQIKEAIIILLQETLRHPGPSITHFLLGIEASVPQKSFMNMSDNNNNCMKALVYLLDNYALASKQTETLNAECEKICERAYNLLYLLCSHNRTSEGVLRYLRSCNDFLSRHVHYLSSKSLKVSIVIFQISHVLKCMAIELKYIAVNCQISRFQQIAEFLTGTSGKNSTYNIPVELINYRSSYSLFTGNCIKTNETENKMNTLCRILFGIDTDVQAVKQPKWDFFDNSLTKQALADCEMKSVHGHKVINIKKLHDILYSELGYIQSSIASSQHKFIVNEIQSVLRFAIEINSEKTKQFASTKALESWGQVTEILFSCAPELAISTAIKKELTLDILQNILTKLLPSQPPLEMSILASGTVLLLLVNLRNCFTKDSGLREIAENSNIQNMPLDANIAEAISKSNYIGLKYVLKNLLEWILLSGVSSQKLRINLYSALLSTLQIIKSNNTGANKDNSNNTSFSLNKSVHHKSFFAEEPNQQSFVLEVFLSYGEKLIEIISIDAVSGHDICKMLAFSCLDTILDMELIPGTLEFIVNRGYLNQIVESLKNTDENLCKMMCNISENMKTFYLYESKMSMLLRIANSQFGAEVILSNNILFTLSNMSIFDMHPDLQGSMHPYKRNTNEFLPAFDTRFRQILFPALNLCNSVLSTLGADNHSAVSQIMHFLFSHSDMIEVVLRNASPEMDLTLLEEVSGLTNLIARTFNQDLYMQSFNPGGGEVQGNLLKIHKLMLLNLDKFIINENRLKNLCKNQSIIYEPTENNENLHKKYILEIAANLALYCRNSISDFSTENKLPRAIFNPSLTDIINREEKRNNFKRNGQSISIVLTQIRGCVEYFNSQKTALEHIVQQKNALANISFDQSSMNSFRHLSELFAQKNYELMMCAFIAEQCLYLLWSHLDLFIRHFTAKKSDENNIIEMDRSQMQELAFDTSQEEMGNLRKCLIALLNETFCKQLLETSEFFASESLGFNEVLIRRIKHMTQFV